VTDPKLTPPPELVGQWYDCATAAGPDYLQEIADRSAQWGADRQLEADAEWLDQNSLDALHLTITPTGKGLVEAMRPKPPSLKEQALNLLAKTNGPIMLGNPEYRLRESEVEIIRRALEQLED
jgi:hypothetical protein